MVTFLISVVYFIYGGKTELPFPCILRKFSEEAESIFTFLKKADILGVLTVYPSMIRSSKDVL